MWILRWVLISLVIILLIGFSLQNTKEIGIVIFDWNSVPIPVYLIVFFAFAAGCFFSILLAVFHQIKLQFGLKSLQKTNKQLLAELEELRAVETEDGEETKEVSANQSIEPNVISS
ncbi:DUF1049 domain-containing protein [bacterium]|nr:DUF1049 domain-containing protein [bacterium]